MNKDQIEFFIIVIIVLLLAIIASPIIGSQWHPINYILKFRYMNYKKFFSRIPFVFEKIHNKLLLLKKNKLPDSYLLGYMDCFSDFQNEIKIKIIKNIKK